MPATISYERTPLAIQYETDQDGTLHIAIPCQPAGLAGRNRVLWLGFLLAPVALVTVTLCVFRDTLTLEIAVVVASAVALMGISYAWLADRKFKCRVWIDATPLELTIQIQRGTSNSARSFSRDRLRAIDVIRDRNTNETWDDWLLRIHGPYEWEILLNHLSRTDSDAIAERLRAQLQLPSTPELAQPPA